ncbi:unnamed protein product [Prorocentrum cordatum]|uniref:Uncharacterized protein n=1 Tax=Prorocentrum cordatum TaxID=2364126 RepID=A0ABN9UJ52_9DINO|nr:unnamed protein product [Polarella glacialis]
MHPADAPKLWIQESPDGVGTRIHNMIMGMAVAAKNGMNTAGFVSIPFECPIRVYHGAPYGVDPKIVYDFFFGLNSTDLFVNRRQPHVTKYANMAELEKYCTDVVPLGKPDPLAPGSQSMLDQSDVLMQFGALRTTKPQILQYLTKDRTSSAPSGPWRSGSGRARRRLPATGARPSRCTCGGATSSGSARTITGGRQTPGTWTRSTRSGTSRRRPGGG